MILPSRDYKFYGGIDPGFEGAIGLMSKAGTMVQVWDMPVTQAKGKKDRQREIDLEALTNIFRSFKCWPDVCLGIEWPTTRPGEGAERAERFGRGKGYLEAFAYLHHLDYFKLAPNLWKGRLGLPGKEKDPTSKATAAAFATFYPSYVSLVTGPRGGALDGRLDALMIAHFLRVQGGGMAQVAKQFGKNSTEALAFVLSGGGAAGKHRRGMLPRI